MTRTLAALSQATARETGVIIDRRGIIRHVICGDRNSILIPDLSYLRRGAGRLKGLRCIHTHLKKGKGLNSEDLTDLALLRLDAMAAVEVQDGMPGPVHLAYLLPPNSRGRQWETLDFPNIQAVHIPFLDFVKGLENEMQAGFASLDVARRAERAILVHASPMARDKAEASLTELRLLAESANIHVLESIHQRIARFHPGHLMGYGKLRDILMEGLHLGATMVVFDQNLSPTQINNIARMVDLKVVDRTQLILDIFARRAQSREGRIQVELAQMRYLLPRLVGRGTAMSRLTGGIGGRGPGETKLEVDRRRVKQRITSLERELRSVARRRKERRKKRARTGQFLVSLIGYTNAGKSTLLNTLTGSNALTEDKLFATLDPSTRRLTFRGEGTVLVSDTVGFIHNMPKELRVAFRSTMEELEDADLFLHVIDASSPAKDEEAETVEAILDEMGLDEVPRIKVYNKIDLLSGTPTVGNARHSFWVSAKNREGINELVREIHRVALPALSRHTEIRETGPAQDHRRSSNPQEQPAP